MAPPARLPRRPLVSLLSRPPKCPRTVPPPSSQRLSAIRHFSNTLCAATAREGRYERAMKPRHLEKVPSFAVQTKQVQVQLGPNDVGLMAGTLIMPTGAQLPSLLKAPLYRSKMEMARMSKRVKDFASIIVWKFIQRPRLRLSLRKTAATAVALHRQMYTALADGDKTTLAAICCDGLHTRLRSRINTRKPGETYTWTIHSYTSSPRVVSHRASPLSIEDGAGRKTAIRQAVVKLKSRQSLQRFDKDGKLVDGSGEEKEVTEYVVVQKMLWKGVEGEWLIWGTEQETTLKDFQEALHPTIGMAAT